MKPSPAGSSRLAASSPRPIPARRAPKCSKRFRAKTGIHAEWSVNEKVALEVAIGGALSGVRSLACMKHVGVNVAADPLMTVSYTGVNAGLVLMAADDPGMFSSQNEQDTRHFARMGKIPCIEPTDSAEAKQFIKAAFELSESFDTPVILRTTTRISHCKSVVEVGTAESPAGRGLAKDFGKYVMLPSNAKKRHVFVEDRLNRLKEWAETSALNQIIDGDTVSRLHYLRHFLPICTRGFPEGHGAETRHDLSAARKSLSRNLPHR